MHQSDESPLNRLRLSPYLRSLVVCNLRQQILHRKTRSQLGLVLIK